MLKRPEIPELIRALGSANDAVRESAVARLTLIGELATHHVASLVRDATAPSSARTAGLRVLAATGGRAATDAAAAALTSNVPALVEEACDLLGRCARDSGSPDGARALDELTGLALSADAPGESRLAAMTALDGLPDRLMRPIYEALAKDSSSRVVSRAARQRAGRRWSLESLLERDLGDDPALVAAAVRDDAAELPVTTLRRVIEALRRREDASGGARRASWLAIRGALHAIVAERGSRVALYDLREAFESTREPLPIGFLRAAAAIGDATCLESLAALWETCVERDRWYRDHLADVFGAIVRRERITRAHSSVKRLLTHRPSAAPLIALAPKSVRGKPPRA